MKKLKVINEIFEKINKKVKEKLQKFIFPRNYFFFSCEGYCFCCEQYVTFYSLNSWLRDYFFCDNCLSIPRERALMLTIEKFFPNWKTLKIHESSPGNRGASLKLKKYCPNYIASQYYQHKPLGSIFEGFRNEDLENQTFEDELFDIVITQDVIEHIYNPEKAFKEIARTLKKGGAHIFTVPIVNKFKKSEVWATKGTNGKPIFLKTSEYHGNPIDLLGSPVTMHWGYDICDFIKQSSGLETIIESIDNLDYGIRAEFIEVLISIKK